MVFQPFAHDVVAQPHPAHPGAVAHAGPDPGPAARVGSPPRHHLDVVDARPVAVPGGRRGRRGLALAARADGRLQVPLRAVGQLDVQRVGLGAARADLLAAVVAGAGLPVDPVGPDAAHVPAERGARPGVDLLGVGPQADVGPGGRGRRLERGRGRRRGGGAGATRAAAWGCAWAPPARPRRRSRGCGRGTRPRPRPARTSCAGPGRPAPGPPSRPGGRPARRCSPPARSSAGRCTGPGGGCHRRR